MPLRMNHSQFKKAAKQHQINYKEKNISRKFNTHKTWLTDDDGKAGKNFYDGFAIFKAVEKRYPDFYVNLYSEMLRSEHVPFNLFVPLRQDLDFCKVVFNELLGGCIKSIDRKCILCKDDNIVIEFAPSPKENYLDDRTSFDAYIEYTHIDNTKGIIGIEVKYTEKEYKIDAESIEAKVVGDKSSLYYTITEKSKIYKQDYSNDWQSDLYRQIWRNQLLAESIRLVHNNVFKHSSSLTFFPEGNGHFAETSKKYLERLKDKTTKFIPVTYEEFISICRKNCPNEKFYKWINYLEERYIVKL